MDLIAQQKYFIEKCETLEDLNRCEFPIERCYEGKIPTELKEVIEKQKSIINEKSINNEI